MFFREGLGKGSILSEVVKVGVVGRSGRSRIYREGGVLVYRFDI